MKIFAYALSVLLAAQPVLAGVCVTPPPPPPPVPAYYVATTGNDSNAGTLAAPFLTLAKAQTAMRASGTIKTTYLRAGSYAPGAVLNLTSADNGETWSYYPPDGVNSATINGGGTSALDGFVTFTTPAANIVWDGIKFTNCYATCFYSNGQTNSITIENSDIGTNVTGNGSVGFGGFSPLIGLVGTNILIANNYVHDAQSQGIGLYAYSTGTSIAGSVIKNNVVLRAVQGTTDGGAIYLNMHWNTGPQNGWPAQNVLITNNYVAEQGSAAGGEPQGIYLDDNTSNATVTGNVIGPPGAGVTNWNGTSCIFNTSGNTNLASGNICDLGSSSDVATENWLYYAGEPYDVGQLGHTFQHNIVISNFTGALNASFGGVGSGAAFLQSTSPNGYSFSIGNNVYWNYASGGSVYSNGLVTSDGSPVNENPQISGPTYTIAGTSPVFSSPISFPGISGGWGPPGFVVPSGIPRSSP